MTDSVVGGPGGTAGLWSITSYDDATLIEDRYKTTIEIGTLKFTFTYNQPVNQPRLPTPDGNAQDNPPELPQEFPPSPELRYFEKVDNVLERYNLTPEQENKVMFALMMGIPLEDPALADILLELETKVAEEVVEEFGLAEEWKPEGLKKSFKKNLKLDYNRSFKKQLQGMNLKALAKELGIPESELRAMIRFGHYFPDQADPQIREILGKIENSALNELSGVYGMPDGWKPESVNNSKHVGELMANYDLMFEEALAKYAQENNLTQEQINRATYLHYHPEAEGYDDAAGIKNEIETNVLKTLRSQYSLPLNFEVKSSALSYDSVVNGDFRFVFQDLLTNQQPPLTKEQLDAINAALANPNDPNITAKTKALIEKLKNEAIGIIKQKYSLPVNWTPSVDLKPLSLAFSTTWNSLQFAQEGLDELNQVVIQMKDSSEKSILMNILALISKALTDLKLLLYRIQSVDAGIARKMSEAETEANLHRAEKQTEEEKDMNAKRKEMEKKQKKAKVMSKVMKILGPVILALTVALAILSGGSLAFLAVTLIVGMFLLTDAIYTSAKGSEKTLLAQGFEQLNKALMEIAGDDEGKKAGAMILQWLVVIVAIVATRNPALVPIVFSQTSIVANSVKAANGEDKTAQYAQMAADILVAILSGGMAIKCIAKRPGKLGRLITGKAKDAGKTGVEVAGKAGKDAVAKAASKSEIELVKKAMDGSKKAWAELFAKYSAKKIGKFLRERGLIMGQQMIATGTGATGAAKGFIQAQTHFMQAELTLQRGDLDAFLVEIQQLVKLLRKLIDKLLSGLGDIAEDNKSIDDLLSGYWGSKSDAITKISMALDTRG